MMKLTVTVWTIIPLLALFSITPSKSSSIRSNDSKYTDEALADEITDMPNLDYVPGFRQFSGYLHLENSEKYIFYWYVESQNDPENDPLAYWTNGGPGCSGLLGFGTEMGPFNFRANETIEENPYSWNKISNMLFVEQPAGVGFSYSNDPTDYITGDEQAALDQYEIILAFFRKFPEKKLNDFYITSESYGGHYIPQLALTILEKDIDKEINFKGFAVGNPWVHAPFDVPAFYEMYHSRSLVPWPLYDKWLKYDCNDLKNRDSVCDLIEAQFYYDAGYDINPYAIDYPICVDGGGYGVQNNHLWSYQGAQLLLMRNPQLQGYVDNYEPCAADYFTEYLNRNDVQKALHVTEGLLSRWGVCDDIVNSSWDITDFYESQVPNYNELISGNNGLKMLVFSGDDDGVCPTEGTQQWIFGLLDVKPMSDFYWLTWHVNDQTAGYATKFNTTYENNSFMFITVHGAGHEVPAYKPAEAFDLWERFLTDSWELTVDSSTDSWGDDVSATMV